MKGMDSEVARWTDEVVRLCDKMIEVAGRVRSLKKWWAALVIQRVWRRFWRRKVVRRLEGVCLEVRLYPGVGVEYMDAKRRFENII